MGFLYAMVQTSCNVSCRQTMGKLVVGHLGVVYGPYDLLWSDGVITRWDIAG